jgi:hypothetical protein
VINVVSNWIALSGKSTSTENKENSKLSGIMVEDISGIGKVETTTFAKIEPRNFTATFCNTFLK